MKNARPSGYQQKRAMMRRLEQLENKIEETSSKKKNKTGQLMDFFFL